MGNIFENNLNLIKQYWPHIPISNLLENKGSSVQLDYQILLEKCKKDGLTAKIKKGDKSCYLNSKYDPFKEAEVYADSIRLKKDSVLLLFGFGFGYHVNAILNKFGKENRLIVIEPDFGIFNLAMHHIDLTEIIKNDKIYLCIRKNREQLKSLLSNSFDLYNNDNIRITSQINYFELFGDYFKDLKGAFSEALIGAQLEKNTIVGYSMLWQKSYFKNFKYIFNSYTALDFIGKFKDIPVVIVSAGPSLDKNVHLLTKFVNKALIISTYSALATLLKNNIIPNFIISVDVRQHTFSPSNESNKQIEILENYDIPLLYVSVSSNELVQMHKGHKVFLTNSYDKYIEYLFGSLDIFVENVFVGGSVVSTAVHFSTMINADPIIFIGQDYAFTNNKHHASGIYENVLGINAPIDKEDFLVDDVFGNKVYTSLLMNEYKKWVEKFIEFDCSDRIYIDATEGGALIKGTKISTLEDVIEQYYDDNIDINSILNGIFENKPIYSDGVKTAIHKDLVYCSNCIGELIETLEESKTVMDTFIQNYHSLDRVRIEKIINEVEEFGTYINTVNNATKLFDFIFKRALYMTHEFINTLNTTDIDENIAFAKEKSYYFNCLKESLSDTICELKNLENNINNNG